MSSSGPQNDVPPNFASSGCAFSGQSMHRAAYHSNNLIDASTTFLALQKQERRTIIDLLHPKISTEQAINDVKISKVEIPSDLDVLATALGAPARRVLLHAEAIGPSTGWKDGYLSSKHGFLPPDPSSTRIALAFSAGRVWLDLCERMPAVVSRGRIREEINALPLISGDSEVIPDSALWAAATVLGLLATTFRYEACNNGHEGISLTLNGTTHDHTDEEPETAGLPRCIAIPLRLINTRMGRKYPYLSVSELSIHNYKIRDQTSVHPYLERQENMELMWPVFDDRSEQAMNLCFAEVHGCCKPVVELIATCQEKVMQQDNLGLLRTLVKIKECVDQLSHVFHKISVNPSAGENFVNPVVWGARVAKWGAPLSTRVPAMSGLSLPLFQMMDVFLGRVKYDTFLGIESFHGRSWQPMNVRAFIAAIEYHYPVAAYIKASGDPCLNGVLNGIVESYAGERGFMGTHRYKVYGFLEVVAKTGRAVTNGNPGAIEQKLKLWQQTHQLLSESMVERLEPYYKDVSVQPQEMRGTFEECRFGSRIMGRECIDKDKERTTGKVSFDVENTGLTFKPGDRLAVMPMNSDLEIEKLVSTLGIESTLQQDVSVLLHPEWKRFGNHLSTIGKRKFSGMLSVYDVLRRGHLAPLSKTIVLKVKTMLQSSSTVVENVLNSDAWPVRGSLGDLLQVASTETSPAIWDNAFNTSDLSWLLDLIPVEVPRTYSISSFSREPLPHIIDLTVGRSSFKTTPALNLTQDKLSYGVSSGFLNPDPSIIPLKPWANIDETILIGLSQPLNFELPISRSSPIVMFAGGSGIAPFRGFWQARAAQSSGKTILFLGVQSREKLLYEDEIRNHVRNGNLEFHVALSRDRNSLRYNPSTNELDEHPVEPRYIDAAIIENGRRIYDMVMPKKSGGLGGYLYICGSVSLYETVMHGIKQAMYNSRNIAKAQVDDLVAVAFAERRFMLDIFMTPQSLSSTQKSISLTELARHTGHKVDARMWIGVHGSVYDITDFLPLHPGGSFIAAASGGIDASQAFDDLAHTNNPEVSSLLTKYFIGHLAPKPELETPEVSKLYDQWSHYLRGSVELLTTMGLEVQDLLENSSLWITGGMLDAGGIRKFYQFQSRLMKGGLAVLFGANLQEIYLQLSYLFVSTGTMSAQLPDILGRVAEIQTSLASSRVSKEIAQIGKWVCSSHEVQFHEKSLLRYAKAVTQIDLAFLENIRDDCCTGLEAFEIIQKKAAGSENENNLELATFLMSVLDRIVIRLNGFYTTTAKVSLFHPETELNPARSRFNILRSKIRDRSFFVLCKPLVMEAPTNNFQSWQQILQHFDFQDVIARTKQIIAVEEKVKRIEEERVFANGPQRLADSHLARLAVAV